MESRRLARTVIDPKVRHVGFFTSGDFPARSLSVPADTSASAIEPVCMPFTPPTDGLSSSCLSPVMNPPTRHAAEGLPSLCRTVDSSTPLLVQAVRSPLRFDGVHMSIESCSSSEQLQSQILSSSSISFSGSEFSEETEASGSLKRSGSEKEANYVSKGSGELMVPIQSYWNTPNKTTLTTASVVKTLREITGLKQNSCYFVDKDGTSVDTIHGGVGTARAKQKVTKAER